MPPGAGANAAVLGFHFLVDDLLDVSFPLSRGVCRLIHRCPRRLLHVVLVATILILILKAFLVEVPLHEEQYWVIVRISLLRSPLGPDDYDDHTLGVCCHGKFSFK